MNNVFRQFYRSRNRGFTAVELMIALAILLIVIALGYEALHHTYLSFQEGERQWIAQKEVQKLTDWFDRNLKDSYELLIYNNTGAYNDTTVFDSDDDYIYIYQAADKKVYFRDSNAANAQLLTEVPVGVEFKMEAEDPDTPVKAMSYSVSIKREDNITDRYKMDSTISFANMLRSSGVNRIGGVVQTGTADTGNMVKLQNNTSDLSSIQINTSSTCFIATAAYGAPSDLPVRILRQFRDRFLLTNELGTAFVDYYYKNSPPIAAYIESRPVLKDFVCIMLLPVVLLAFICLTPQASLCVAYFSIPALLIRMYKKKYNGLGGFKRAGPQ